MPDQKKRPFDAPPLARDWKVGDYVRFAHVPDGGPSFRVRAIGNNGMLTIDGMTGEFAPHIFVPGEGGHGDASR